MPAWRSSPSRSGDRLRLGRGAANAPRVVWGTSDIAEEARRLEQQVSLRALGFTGQKAAYCHDLAVAVCSGQLDLGAIARTSEDMGRATLLQVRGLGEWSVPVYYLMALRRPDVWPSGDVALADAVHRVKRLRARPDHDRLTRLAERWAPWRSVTARILWHHYLSVRKPQG